MKQTMLVIVLALIVTAGAAFAQGVPQERVTRAKEQFRTKQHVLRAKSAVRQKREILLDKGQAAKARHMMKLMTLGVTAPYDQYTYRPSRVITGRGLERPRATMYPKCEALCRMSGQACPAMRDGGIRGKQGFTGKRMMQHHPLRDKLRQHTQPQGK